MQANRSWMQYARFSAPLSPARWAVRCSAVAATGAFAAFMLATAGPGNGVVHAVQSTPRYVTLPTIVVVGKRQVEIRCTPDNP